ncbi:MAG: ferredoxin [Niastella sp.]|nr:ferredoxin [Niastella sp.]
MALLGKKFPDRHPENAEGDFYSMDGVCISCGAPEAEAPKLIEHSVKDGGHCHFKRQPQTPEEVEQAIQALAVSCIASIRYGGKDEAILKRLYEMGLGSECDHEPVDNYSLLAWDKAHFRYTGSLTKFYNRLVDELVKGWSHLKLRIIPMVSAKKDHFEFSYSWAKEAMPVTISVCIRESGLWELQIATSGEYQLQTLRHVAITINYLLRHEQEIEDITWYDMDGKSYEAAAVC